jgi:uncharacterized membrane-anchored protein
MLFGPVPGMGEAIVNIIIGLLVLAVNFYVGYRVVSCLKGEQR